MSSPNNITNGFSEEIRDGGHYVDETINTVHMKRKGRKELQLIGVGINRSELEQEI